MKVILKKVNHAPEVIEIDNSLKTFQKLVGGLIEVAVFHEDILMIVDEEGKLKGKAPNFFTPYDFIVGDVVFVKRKGEDFTDLTDEQIKLIFQTFK